MVTARRAVDAITDFTWLEHSIATLGDAIHITHGITCTGTTLISDTADRFARADRFTAGIARLSASHQLHRPTCRGRALHWAIAIAELTDL
ncbi:MAG: hypothetical protein CME13_05520 [Gemmatimonadetes bacterium]|nr:hypothetical protein [Gemmatimonadota bacterium]